MTIDVEKGLARTRIEWVKARGGVEQYDGRPIQPVDNGNATGKYLARNFPNTPKPWRALNGKPVTQYEFAKAGVITKEMIYVATREHLGRKQQLERAAAVLVATPSPGDDGAGAFAVRPGILIRGEVARLLDRGYQKFIKTSQFELPATASQLHAIHAFTEELNKVTGAMGLYNEGLGTTSDVYQYDRLRGRETPQAAPARPWELSNGH